MADLIVGTYTRNSNDFIHNVLIDQDGVIYRQVNNCNCVQVTIPVLLHMYEKSSKMNWTWTWNDEVIDNNAV